MITKTARRLGRRAALAGLAMILLAALPGVAIASLPAHPAPTHACCTEAAPMPQPADCGSSPCCIEKPAPRTFSVLTGDAVATVPAAALVAPIVPVLPVTPAAEPSPAPRARSAPLFVLFAAFLN